MSRVVIDLRMVRGTLHGIARYALELARRIPLLAPEHRFAVLHDRRERLDLPPGVEQIACRSPFLDPREQLELVGLLAEVRPDLVHWTSFSVPVLATTPSVITLHDANHLAFPEHYGHWHSLYYRAVVVPAARRARRVITVSHFAARELEERLGLPAAATAVISNGVDPRFHRVAAAERAAIRARYALPERFALYVGNLKPHKNVPLLVEAAALAQIPLVAVVPELPIGQSPRVLWRDGVTDAELPALYSAASVFGFPSRYEGFGLPPVEALACGTPVVASNAASLPEVLGDAALLLAPDDPPQWATALTQAAADQSPASAQRRAGWARQYNWDRTANETLEIYRSALGGDRTASP
jgi:glycosyltransferase involved in cell wall biosynthesis